MVLITLAAFAIHCIVILRTLKFFAGGSDARDGDKAIVAGVGVLSALFVASQLYTAGADPLAFFSNRVTLRTGFDASVAFIFLCVVVNLVDAHERRGEPH